jgi:hypothetical protein
MKPWYALVLCLVTICFALYSFPQQPDPPHIPVTQSGNSADASPLLPVLPEGTPVKLKLQHSLHSKTVVTDDPLNFLVTDDVIVDGKRLIGTGAVAIGRVRQAKAARTLGRGAQLTLEMQYVKVGRIRVPLRGSQTKAGENKTDETVALVALFGISALVKHGSEIDVKEGSLFTAYVDHDTQLQQASTSAQ